MSKLTKAVTSSALLSTAFMFVDKAYAQVATTPATTRTLQEWVPFIFNWVSILAGLIFVVMFLVGGIQYLTSAGNEEQASKAKKLLVDAVVGLIIVMVAYGAGRYVLGQLGLTTVPGVPASQ